MEERFPTRHLMSSSSRNLRLSEIDTKQIRFFTCLGYSSVKLKLSLQGSPGILELAPK